MRKEKRIEFSDIKVTELSKEWYKYDHGTYMKTGNVEIYLPENKVKSFRDYVKAKGGKIIQEV